MSVVLLGGLLAEIFFSLGWIDYVASALLLGFVAKEAVESFKETRD